MLILNMLLRITGFNQEELANYIGISRASINYWLNDDSSMSELSKKKIAEKFEFPIMFFDYDLDQNIELYKIIYSSICTSWNKNNKIKVNEKKYKMQNILNEIEKECVYENSCSNEEILHALLNGYNPFTGELFEQNHILNDIRVKKAIMYNNNSKTKKFGFNNITKDDLSTDEKILFEKLKIWRRQKTDEENYFKAYIVFSDKDLFNIIKANIQEKNELLNVKGIGITKFEKYSDEIFEIICNHNKKEGGAYE